MLNDLHFYSYNTKERKKLKSTLASQINSPWLQQENDLIFQICDELVKNAFKSNYKFLLIRKALFKRLSEKNPEMTSTDAENWLTELLYSGENTLITKQLEKIKNMEVISDNVRKIINIENKVLERKRGKESGTSKNFDQKYKPLLEIRKLSKKYKVTVKFKVEKAGDRTLITIANACPILENDVKRIQNVRKLFREYYDAGRSEFFFVENIDITGGGHGLGYALMDSILLQMKLEPSEHLYLVPVGTTMVLLVLPHKKPT